MIVSLIVPVYNTAEYLDRCLSSIVNQGVDENDFEVIIINDGSTDNSAELIEGWRDKIKNIVILHTSNHGLGSARNKGIGLSKGKYLFFVDSDDYLAKDSLLSLVEFVRSSDIDIIGFNWLTAYTDGKEETNRGNKIQYNSLVSGAEYMSQHNLKAGVCFYLYRSAFLKSENITMPEGIYHEDELFMPQAFIFAKQITFVDSIVYAYYQRKDSISNKNDVAFFRKRIDDCFWVLDSLLTLSADEKLKTVQQQALKRKIHFFALDLIVNIIRTGCNKSTIDLVTNYLSEKQLFPLPKEAYGWKYNSFRVTFLSKKNILIASKLNRLIK